jgi:hypothetical protein
MKSGRGSRRSLRYSIFIGVLAGSVFSSSGAFAAIEISTQAGLEAIDSSLNENYILLNNIVLEGSPTAVSSYVAGNFQGTFDGNSKTISGLLVPLFDIIGGDGSASVSDLILETSAEGVSGNGALANSTYLGTTLENIQVLGDITGTTDNVGGLVGSFSGDITNSSVTGTVIGTNTAGGLVGVAYGDISDSTFTGAVQGQRYVGGLVGVTGSSTISNSSASGTVTGLIGGEGNIGGLVGGGSGMISNSTASVTVTGYADTSNIGGLIGNADVSVQVIDSSSSGSVSGTSNVGGLAGQISGSFISNSSSSAAVNGVNNVGGLVGNAIGGTYFGTARGIPSPENGDPGFLAAEIEDSHSTGAVNGGTHTGGLIGHLEGDVTNSYSLSSVNQLLTGDNAGNRLGGLVGVLASGSVSDSYATGGGYSLGGYDFVGGLIGQSAGNVANSYAAFSGNVSGYGTVGGLIGSTNGNVTNSYSYVTGNVSSTTGYVGGLAGYARGEISNSYSNVSGDVIGTGDYVGGLVGYAEGSVNNSYSTVEGDLIGSNYVGGLVGYTYSPLSISNSNAYVFGDIDGGSYIGGLIGVADSGTTVLNSNSRIDGNINGLDYMGGLVGFSGANITNSNTLILGNLTGEDFIGGLVGYSYTNIQNSDVSIRGNLSATGHSAGGLVGYFSDGSITNSNSQITGTFSGNSEVGGLIGSFYGGNISSSFFMLNEIVGGIALTDLFGYHYTSNPSNIDYTDTSLVWNVSEVPEFPTKLQILNNLVNPAVFAIDECLNGPNPYLVSLFLKYENSCAGGDGGSPTPVRRERAVREVIETRTLEKIEKTLGFKNDKPLPNDAVIAFLQSTDKIDIAKVKSLEITPNAIVRVNAKTEEALQISLKSESKAPVELWVLSPDGKWLLAGVITFDKDGKAILPPLLFKNVGDYSLVFSTPSADSTNASAPLNLSGQVLISFI